MKSSTRNWIDPIPCNVPDDFKEAIGGHPLVAETLFRRGITDVARARAFLDPQVYRPCSGFDLTDMDRAVERIQRAIQGEESIWVWGDFDVDGQTSTTTLVDGLRKLGGKVNFHVPVRARESHGINLPELEKILSAGANLIVTCDTGISGAAEVRVAQERGVDVIVTDHHDLPEELPPAYAVVNPKRMPETHPLRHLPGVGVAYKLIESLAERLGRPEVAAEQLDLAALGIVADLAWQAEETRYLLQLGLRQLRENKRLGLREMFKSVELNPEYLCEEHIGFIIGPRLNALGRLSDANPAVEFLTTADPTRARILAAEMEGLNAQRRLLVDQVYQAAKARLEQEPALLSGPGLVLEHPAWPAGVIGIVASRLVEQYGMPTILIAAPEGETARGSARSVAGVHITEAIGACSALLQGFGGHPMAAGLGMARENIPAFRKAFNRAVEAQIDGKELRRDLPIDRYMTLDELNLDLVEQIERLAPFGQGNPALVLATRGLKVSSVKPIGRNGEHLRLGVEDEQGRGRSIIWWQGAGQDIPEGKFDLAYTVRASDFQGQRDVQIEWLEARVIEAVAVEAGLRKRGIEIVDFRREPNHLAILKNLRQQQGTLQTWREVESRVEGKNRLDLEPGAELAIWTTPAGNTEFQEVVEKVAPQKIYLFAHDPEIDWIEAFANRLAGLLKYSLKNDRGMTNIARLAAAMGHRGETVQKGLEWMEAKGYFGFDWREEGECLVRAGTGQEDRMKVLEVEAQLRAMLEETAAYRKFFALTSAESLAPMRKKG